MTRGELAEARLASLYRQDGQLSFGRGFLACVCFCLALWAGSSTLRAALRNLPGISAEEPGPPRIKDLHWREYGDRYDLAFVGSSRIFRQLDPRLFEQVCAKKGLELRAYNWGLPGMRTYESLQRVQRLCENKPEKLKWIVIELLPQAPQMAMENLRSLREIQWHEPRMSSLAMRRSWSGPGKFDYKREQLGYHAYQCAANLLNMGSVQNAWEQWVQASSIPLDEGDSGFFPLELDRSPKVRERRQAFMTELRVSPELLLERVRAFQNADKQKQPSALLVEQIESILALTSAAGVEPIFVIVPPLEQLLPQMVGAHADGVLPNLFHYADPQEFRSFYANGDWRFDMNHLNDKGLARLTRRLAADFVNHVEAQSAQ